MPEIVVVGSFTAQEGKEEEARAAFADLMAPTHDEPGCILWNELITSDLSAAAAFYEQVLGLTAAAMDMGDAKYTVLQAGDAMVGGATEPPLSLLPNHWHVYFAVDDADAAAAKISELGGEVVVPPFDIQVGRISMARDPQGALFSIIRSAS